MGRLSGKIAAVSGGAGGIGEATVRLFLEEGAKVVFSDTNASDGQRLADELGRDGGDARFIQADMRVEADAARFIGHAETHHGGLDILVNNAGIRTYQSVTEASEESWDRMLGVNLKGYAFCAKAAIPLMVRSGGGNVVNVASIRSVVAGAKTVQYDTTKAAILGLTRSMARDHASEGIRVNAVGPGPIFTQFHAERARETGVSELEYTKGFGADTLLGRPGTPREVAQGIAFLASDDATFVTGTCLFIDGGLLARGDG